MAKRGLSADEIQRLLDASDSGESDSEFDDSDDASSSSSDGNGPADSDDSDATVDYDAQSPFAWSDHEVFHRSRLAFNGKPGRQLPIDNTQDPLEYFNLYFTDQMLDVIVTETNRRAQQLIAAGQAGKRRSRLNYWVIAWQLQFVGTTDSLFTRTCSGFSNCGFDNFI